MHLNLLLLLVHPVIIIIIIITINCIIISLLSQLLCNIQSISLSITSLNRTFSYCRRFSRNRATPFKAMENIFAYYNITSVKITKIQGPQRPYLACNITQFFNWSIPARSIPAQKFTNLAMPTFTLVLTCNIALFW